MKAAIISLGSVSSQWTLNEMSNYFDEVENINLKEIEIELGKDSKILYKGKPLEKFNCIYAKGSFRYAALLNSVTTLIPKETFMPIHSNAFFVGHDKLLTHVHLQQAKIPMPKTYLSPTVNYAKNLLKNIPYPIVMKFPKGTQGKGVMFADSYSSAISILDALTALNQPVIIQEYIESGGADVRAIVIGDKVVAAMQRKSKGEDKRSNIHAGGIGVPYSLNDETKMIAVKAAKAIGIGICGVDMLMIGQKPLVIEVNLSPGLQGITKATKINVAQKIAKYLYDNSKEHKKIVEKKEEKKILANEGMIELNGLKQIVYQMDYRGSRILLPEIVGKITGFNDSEEVVIEAKKGFMQIKKH